MRRFFRWMKVFFHKKRMSRSLLQSDEPVLVENMIREVVDANECLADTIDNINIIELKGELIKCGLSKKVLKVVLLGRIKEAIANNITMIENQPMDVTNNAGGDAVEPTIFWK